MRVAAITLAVNLALDLALVPPLGAWGAVIGTTVAFGYYFLRHHLLLENALRDEPGNWSPPLAAALVATAAAVLAAAIRGAMDAAGEPSDIAVLIGAGTLPVLLVAWWASRIVRR
jgi:peptidoglycan biosynthesis protein MviN/MurJ (putative lipid II flippase)